MSYYPGGQQVPHMYPSLPQQNPHQGQYSLQQNVQNHAYGQPSGYASPPGYTQPGCSNSVYGQPPSNPAMHHQSQPLYPVSSHAPQSGQASLPNYQQQGQASIYQQQSPHAPHYQQQSPQAPDYQQPVAAQRSVAPDEQTLFAENVDPGAPTSPAGWSRQGSPKILLSLKATNLVDRDYVSKSDPMALVFLYDTPTKKWYEAGRTEALKDNLNPDWQQEILIDYYFEEVQRFRIEIYDKDSSSNKVKHHDFLGSCEGTIAELVSAKHGKKVLVLNNRMGEPMYHFGKKSECIILAEQNSGSNNELYQLQFSAAKLDDKDFFSKSDPFMEISRQNPDFTWNAIHRTEVIMNNLNPRWKPFELDSSQMCNNDRERKLRFRIYDYDDNGANDLIGDFITSVKDLQAKFNRAETFPVINDKKKARKHKYKNSGVVSINSFTVVKCYSFLDYIKSGTQLNFIVGIDYTASNGDPRSPNSLHYFNPTYQTNQYTTAIRAIGDIVQEYDADKLFPTYGFGARLSNGQVSFCFNVNMTQYPNCFGVDGILHAYRTSLPTLTLYGPTNFAPIINQAARHACQVQDGSAYNVLLILTDGEISDMPETMHEIVQASALPLSIIIVGVGNAGFDAMEILDGDRELLTSPITGQRSQRDIVQFVNLRKILSTYGNMEMSASRLSKEILQEVPTQVQKWMAKRGIMPIG